jgi:uncharacterized iron-regulated membrane protein
MRELGASGPRASIYNAVWRWHFIAGLLVLPFLVSLAVTGALYLFHPEIDGILYRSLETVPLRNGPMLPASTLVQATERQAGGKVLQVAFPVEPARSLTLTIQAPSGERRAAYLDPYDGTLLGTIPQGGVMAIVRKLHSLEFFGFLANCVIEIAAGWVVVLVVSGLYLWWPRGRREGVVTIRATPRSRFFWRDLHAVTGFFASGVILFLAVTGMPWSPIWGKTVQRWTTAAGLGRPAPPVETMARRGTPEGARKQAAEGHDHGATQPPNRPWALQQATAPESRPQSPAGPPLGLDQAVTILLEQGLAKPFSVALPVGPNGAYVATFRPPQVELTRTIYVDQFSGAILGDIRFSDYGPAAKAIEWGISAHQGEEYGALNRYVMLAGCIAIVLLAISAPIMWWKRRPRGLLAVPPPAADCRAALGVLCIVAVAGILLPLVGLTILVALASEGLWTLAKRWSRSRAPQGVS